MRRKTFFLKLATMKFSRINCYEMQTLQHTWFVADLFIRGPVYSYDGDIQVIEVNSVRVILNGVFYSLPWGGFAQSYTQYSRAGGIWSIISFEYQWSNNHYLDAQSILYDSYGK